MTKSATLQLDYEIEMNGELWRVRVWRGASGETVRRSERLTTSLVPWAERIADSRQQRSSARIA